MRCLTAASGKGIGAKDLGADNRRPEIQIMKKTRIAINGFGRIGRLVYRTAWDWQEFDWVLVNDPKADAATCAHLLNFDSVQGRWSHEALAADAGAFSVEGRRVAVGG